MKTPVTIKYIGSVKLVLIMLLAFVLSVTSIHAQSSITVYTIQNIGFGAFATGNTGGTVKISSSGVRTVTGTVIPLNFGLQYRPVIFEIEAPSGTIISFANSLNATLTGSNGGTMSVHLDESDPVLPFNTIVSPPARTQLKMGGTLTVGNPSVSPPGTYTGTLDITFNYQ
jgi:hypothetical protein